VWRRATWPTLSHGQEASSSSRAPSCRTKPISATDCSLQAWHKRANELFTVDNTPSGDTLVREKDKLPTPKRFVLVLQGRQIKPRLSCPCGIGVNYRMQSHPTKDIFSDSMAYIIIYAACSLACHWVNRYRVILNSGWSLLTSRRHNASLNKDTVVRAYESLISQRRPSVNK
jgi:hypothetical protein